MSKYRGFIGSYTKVESKGINSFIFNKDNNNFKVENFIKVENPTYLTLSKDKKILYSSMSKKNLTGVLSVNLKTLEKKELLFKNEATPCYISNYDNILLASNYHQGNFDIYNLENGMIDKKLFSINHKGNGPNKKRQESSHIHYSQKSPLTNDIFVTDLGSDKVYIYDSVFKLKDQLFFNPGSGPRHIAFESDQKILYVFTELSNEVYKIDYSKNNFKIIESIKTLKNTDIDKSDGAAIRISKDNNFLYVSNRGHNSISIIDISKNQKMNIIDNVHTEGDHPRDFNLTPDGKYLLVANMNTNNLTLFEVNTKSGELKLIKKDIYSPEPVSIVFL